MEGVVVGIFGLVHQLVVRSETPPRMAETICQGGTWRRDGLEISTTPLERSSRMKAVLVDFFPRAFTSACPSQGLPLWTNPVLATSVATLSFC